MFFMSATALILAQAAPTDRNALLPTLLLWVAVFVVFYLFFIRPQQRRQKQDRLFREQLKKGDRVVLTSGIHGRVASVEGAELLIEVAEGVKLRVDKSAVQRSGEPAVVTAK